MMMKTKNVARRSRPTLEALEARLAPATRVWDGGGTTNLWSDRFNWVADVVVASGDDIIFPDRTAVSVDPTSLSSTNNIAGLTANGITFNDSGYTLSGNALVLGGGGLTFDDPSSPGSS